MDSPWVGVFLSSRDRVVFGILWGVHGWGGLEGEGLSGKFYQDIPPHLNLLPP